ncbi:hypothetical protein [Mycobacterium sp. 141]|uniref:hypothetical protein n=1 Tax=Mycobacterium sp. 141 TaxID=1120797 RepID=UPI001E3E0F2D|nr:hypothetical protein [Mycobacterium sp. 141]
MPHNGVESDIDRASGRRTERVRGHLRLVPGGADTSPDDAPREAQDDANIQPPNDDVSRNVGFTLLTW